MLLQKSFFTALFITASLVTMSNSSVKDSIKIKGPNRFQLGGKTITIHKDTTIFLPDSLEFIFIKNNRQLFKQKEATKNNRLTKHIQSWLFAGKPDTSQLNLNRRDFLNNSKGKIIRNIKINSINVFGASLTDSKPDSTLNWVERTGNKIHKNTSQKLIYNALNLDKGHRIAEYELSEKEVIIRNLPYISDVMITPIDVQNSDSVDLNIAVQDVWSIGFHLEPTSLNKGFFELYDENTFGQGQETLVRLRYDYQKSPSLGMEASYTLYNIGREIIKTRIGYSSYFGYQDAVFNMEKEYYYGSNYAFGILCEDYSNDIHFAYLNKDLRINATINDYWIGKGFPLSRYGTFDITKPQFYAAVRVGNHYFSGERNVSPTFNYALYKKKIFLTSAAIAKQWYNQTKLLLGYGRTEDIPYGYKFEVVSGVVLDEYRNRAYCAFKTSGGDFFRLGYLSGYLNVGSFIKKDSLQQGVFNTGLFYYSNLVRLGLYRFRQFIGFDFTSGFNRFNGYGEQIYLANTNGIRGFTSDSVRASKRAFLRLETVCYSPHQILGFKLAYFLYNDLAWLNHLSKNIFDGPIYYGFGLGVRIRNERLAFKTFSIRLAYYPNLPKGGSYNILDLSGSNRLTLKGFKPSQPEIIPFQ